MKHIFVVDDENSIRDLIRKYLEKEGFLVTMFCSGENVLEEFLQKKPDLIVLDIMMPGKDGLEICREIRKNSDTPIIFVSAKDEEFDRILGLELGGDDYLSKPFSPRELVVRIKKLLARFEKNTNTISESEKIIVNDIIIYCDRRCIKKDDIEIKFTTKEYELFEFLAKNKGIPFSRTQLLDKVWGYDYIGDDRMIDDLIKRIRKKLNETDSKAEIITVWGFGYKIE